MDDYYLRWLHVMTPDWMHISAEWDWYIRALIFWSWHNHSFAMQTILQLIFRRGNDTKNENSMILVNLSWYNLCILVWAQFCTWWNYWYYSSSYTTMVIQHSCEFELDCRAVDQASDRAVDQADNQAVLLSWCRHVDLSAGVPNQLDFFGCIEYHRITETCCGQRSIANNIAIISSILPWNSSHKFGVPVSTQSADDANKNNDAINTTMCSIFVRDQKYKANAQTIAILCGLSDHSQPTRATSTLP